MKLKVLFLDDEPTLCEIFFELFSSDEIEIKTFTDPVEAIAQSRSEHFDLVFIDYRLRRTTGEDVALQMASSLPKYLVTGELDLKVNCEFKEILKKPFDISYMRLILRNASAAIQANVKKSA